MSEGEHLMARVDAHSRSMGPKIDPLLYAILVCLLCSRFVSPLWIRQTGIQGCGSPLINYTCVPDYSSFSFSLLEQPLSPLSCRNEKATAEKLEAKPNLTVSRGNVTGEGNSA
jgi:hypothetical protein